MKRATGSSIRVSSGTRRRVADLAVKLKAANQQEVIDRALEQLEHSLFWQGFEDEARAYLAANPGETEARHRYAGTSSDGIGKRR